MVGRVFLLGILAHGAVLSREGEVESRPIPTTSDPAAYPPMLNLGLAYKAAAIREAAEDFLKVAQRPPA